MTAVQPPPHPHDPPPEPRPEDAPPAGDPSTDDVIEHAGPVTIAPGARSLARRLARPVLEVWLRLQTEGLHHVPADGPVIVASTHASHADSVALGVAIERPVYFLGDLRLTRWPLLGPWLPRLGMVPVRRGAGDRDALGHLEQLLGAGKAVVVYPEGSRSRDGRVYRPRSGVSRLAAGTGVPVVPAAVAGTYDVWPTGSRPRLRGGRVMVRVGAPMAPPDQNPRSRRAFNAHLHDVLVTLSGAPPAYEFSPVGGGEEQAA